jgi:hypothetical protein
MASSAISTSTENVDSSAHGFLKLPAELQQQIIVLTIPTRDLSLIAYASSKKVRQTVFFHDGELCPKSRCAPFNGVFGILRVNKRLSREFTGSIYNRTRRDAKGSGNDSR